MLVSLTPIYLSFYDEATRQVTRNRIAVLALAIKEGIFAEKIKDDSALISDIIKWVGIFTTIFVLLLVFTLVVFFKIADRSLRPIRLLNQKVKMLMVSNASFNIDTAKQNITSKEASIVYEAISELMTARRFTQNDFIKLKDAIAIMEFADAFTVLNKNEQAKGICLTNIAHIYYKNRNYEKAAQSYKNAAQCSKVLFTEAKDNRDISAFHKNVMLYCKRKYYQAT